jgi:hypothetical protein
MKNKISISFIKYPNCNLIKLLWDAANPRQVLWSQRIVRQLRRCGFRRNLCPLWLPPSSPSTRESSINPVINPHSISLPCRNLTYSPKSHRRDSNTERTRVTDSPGSMSPSVHSSDERPRSRITSHTSRPTSSRNGN